MLLNSETLVERLLKRAEIRRSIKDRKSVQEGKPDRIAELLDEAALEISLLQGTVNDLEDRLRGEFQWKYLYENGIRPEDDW